MTRPGMEARFRRVRDLFGKSGVKFEVPPYQRDFEWERKHFEDLWVDIQRIGERVNQHYLGNIILLEKDEGESFEIVDGQQRMITLSILLMAIRDTPTSENNNDRRIDDVISTYPASSAIRRLYLSDEEADESFKHLWNGDTDEAIGVVKEAYDFYYDRVKDYTSAEIDDLLDNIINRLRVVQTVSRDTSLAYMVFQSQNERGKEVSPQILARARIYGEAEDLGNEQDRQVVTGRWNHIYRLLEDNLGGPRFQDDLIVRRPLSQILVNSPISTPTRIDKRTLYRNFDAALLTYDNVVEFVEWFQEQVNIYLELTSKNYKVSGRNIPADGVRHLQYLNSASTHSEGLSLAIYNKIDDENLLVEYFRLASILAMRMELGGSASATVRDAIYTTARDVRETDGIREIRAVLHQSIEKNTPTDPEIIEHLKANNQTIRGPWKFRTLLKMVSIEEERRGPLRLDLEQLDIEHIAPRNTFNNPKYSSWRRRLDSDEFEDRMNKLGNLTLLLPSDHARLDETSFNSKKNAYRNSDVKIAEEIADYDDWTDEEIEERTERLAEELVDRWSI